MTIIHRTGLMPPSFGLVKTWCGRKVPIERTGHVEISGRKPCKSCERIVARKKRLGVWPWRRKTEKIPRVEVTSIGPKYLNANGRKASKRFKNPNKEAP